MEVRRQELEEPFGVTPERLFTVLTTPSAIRSWWGVSKAIVDLRKGGTWVTAWGESDGDSDHVTSFKIVELEPPTLVVLGSSKYIRVGSTLETNMTTEFRIDAHPHGCNLRIVQVLDPHDPFMDDYFDACILGWQNCFEGIRHYLHTNPANEVVSDADESGASPTESVSDDTIPSSIDVEVDRHLTPEEEFRVSKLRAKDLKSIDAALLAEASTSERKISWVVGKTMKNLGDRFSGIPDIFFARRVRKLIGEGKLEVADDPEYIRLSEVRRSRKSK